MIEIRDLSFGYRGRTVGSGVDMSLGRGRLTCLLGPNGCGKTTLFKTILGLLPPLSGHVRIDGRPLRSLPRRAIAQSVAYVPQATAAVFPFLVRDVVLMGRASRIGLTATPSAHDRTVVAGALGRLGLLHLADRPVTAISGGERQMVLIARALAQEAELLVLDEPTANLDFANQARVLDILRVLADSGLAVLMSTHDPDHALACADHVALMSGGRVLAQGAPTDIMTPASLKELYGVEVAIDYLPGARRAVCTPVRSGVLATSPGR